MTVPVAAMTKSGRKKKTPVELCRSNQNPLLRQLLRIRNRFPGHQRYSPVARETRVAGPDHFIIVLPTSPEARRTCSVRANPSAVCPLVRTPRTSPVNGFTYTFPRGSTTSKERSGDSESRYATIGSPSNFRETESPISCSIRVFLPSDIYDRCG